MPGPKDKLSQLLGGETPPPSLRRGEGVRLSTDDRSRSAAVPTTPPIRRVNRGYTLREDYVKALKRIALEDGRKLYEVMDEALGAYLQARAAGDRQ